LRRSTKFLIALLTLGVVLTPIAVIVFFTAGSIVSSAPHRQAVTKVSIPLRPKPPTAVALRAFLRVNGQHPTSCTARGPRMVCLLAHGGGGRCEESSDGHGSCTFRGRDRSLSDELIWVTNNFSHTVTVTSSADFR
jgi:hypothetical protein